MAHVIIAPDSFKGTASADVIASAIASEWRSVRPDDTVTIVPMADGGEGTLDAFEAAYPDARRVPVTVDGPDGRPVDSSWLMLQDGRAVVELAAASGLTLLDELRPDSAHTVGFGQAIAAALDGGATSLLLGIGGSASTDGGLGMLRALGLRIDPEDAPSGGEGLDVVRSIDRGGLRGLPPGGVTVLTDVTAPLLGPSGAAAVFGPQKGVLPDRVPVHEERLARWAALFPDIDPETEGAGAAGGAGFGLLAWGARLAGGAGAVAEALRLPDRIAEADLVITGEGRWDAQSAGGKAPQHVAALATAHEVPAALVAGIITAPAPWAIDSVSLDGIAGARSRTEPEAVARVAGVRLGEAWTGRSGVRPAVR